MLQRPAEVLQFVVCILERIGLRVLFERVIGQRGFDVFQRNGAVEAKFIRWRRRRWRRLPSYRMRRGANAS